MSKIVAIELPLLDNIYRLNNNENSIKFFRDTVENSEAIKNTFLKIDDYHSIRCKIIHMKKYMVAYRYDRYKIVFVAFNKNYANEISLIDDWENTYKLSELIRKMDMLDLKELNNTYFENVLIQQYNKQVLFNTKGLDYKITFIQEEKTNYLNRRLTQIIMEKYS